MSLFELRSGRYFLTEAGEALHHYACKIDALMKEARRVTQEFKDFHKGAITIGASYVPATYLLPEVVHQFQCEFPNIKITLLVKTAPEIRMMLQNHEIDLGIISAAPFDEPLLKQTNIMPDTLVLAFSKEHHFQRKTMYRYKISKRNAYYCIVIHLQRDLLTQWTLAHNITFQSEIELDSLETMKQILKYGNGIAFISKLAIEQEIQRNELCYIPIPEFEFQRNIYTIHHEDRWNSKIISFYYKASLHLQQKLKAVVMHDSLLNYKSIYFSLPQFLLAPLQPYLMLLILSSLFFHFIYTIDSFNKFIDSFFFYLSTLCHSFIYFLFHIFCF